jgi:hypothetical protein
MAGKKVIIRNPPNSYIRTTSTDSIVEWENNDTFCTLNHPVGVKRGVSTVSDFATDYGEVGIQIKFGATDAAVNLFVEAGDYKLEKVNGIWYSVLKNGRGEATKGTQKLNLTGVELRLAWPSTFK